MHDSSFDDLRARLAASDPARGITYRHAHLTAALDSIVADRPARIRVMRSFQLKMASAAAAAAVVTTSAIAALSGAGNSLPILNFAAATATAQSAPGLKVGAMAISPYVSSNYTFTAGASLSSDVPSASVYTQTSEPSAAHSRDLASYFADLDHTTISSESTTDATTTVTYTNGDSFTYSAFAGSLPTFSFSPNASATGGIAIATPMASDSTNTTIPTPTDTPPANVYGTPTDAQMSVLASLDSLASLIGTDALRFTTQNASASDTSLNAWTQEALDGLPVFYAQLNVEATNGVITSVSGSDMTGLSAIAYPLLSAADDVANVGSWSPGYSLGAGGVCEACMGGSVTTTSTAPTPVTLDSATLWLVPRTATSASGADIATLLPAWEYSGQVDTWTGSFWAIAVDPQYLASH